MMNAAAFLFGLAIPAVPAWLLIVIVEGKQPVLHRVERWCWALLFGSPLFMLPLLLLSWSGMHAMTPAGFALAFCLLTLPLGLLAWKRSALAPRNRPPALHPAGGMRKGAMIVLCIAMVWTSLKVGTGLIGLVSVPGYWDDTFNNWNLRGKAMYVTGEYDILGSSPELSVISAQGIGSYPPTVSMTKAWLSVLRGRWSEGLVNAVHGAWFLLGLAAFFFLARRALPLSWSLAGLYLLVSLPLFLIHGVNPYSDVLVAAFVLAACGGTWMAARTTEEQDALTWARLTALSTGLMILIKNEALLIHAPPLLLLLGMALHRRGRSIGTIASILAITACAALPWLVFKWTHGLTFGNAKRLADLAIGFRPDAVTAIRLFLFHEGNFLILPLALPVLLLSNRGKALRSSETVLAFFLLCAIGLQMAAYLFTPLAHEAIFQTGIGRGFVQMAPVAVLLLLLLARDALSSE